jgi:hypothetical protein
VKETAFGIINHVPISSGAVFGIQLPQFCRQWDPAELCSLGKISRGTLLSLGKKELDRVKVE